MFLDEAVVEFISGKGGSGAVSFHREKFVPRGGPNGSDGGRGGDIVLIADRGKRTLYDFKLKSTFQAGNGTHGVGNKKGKNGKSLEIKVPVGTVVTNEETSKLIVDLNRHGMEFTLCRGGKGGFGNQHYATSVRQAPNFAQKGAPEERIRARLELKLLADVALVGLPNAGKSTLISRISAARPKIASYPFTTIVPNLGVVSFRDTSFVVADLPGLIEGASEGVGLGHQFLRHVERCRILAHLVDVKPMDGTDPWANYELIERELKLYSEPIWRRPRLLVLNKVDLVSAEERAELVGQFSKTGLNVFQTSGVTGEGMNDLLQAMTDALAQEIPQEEEILTPHLTDTPEDHWDVKLEDGKFIGVGRRLLNLVAMTDLENRDAVRYLHRRLERIGLIEKLREMGATEGDTVVVGEVEFSFTDES